MQNNFSQGVKGRSIIRLPEGLTGVSGTKYVNTEGTLQEWLLLSFRQYSCGCGVIQQAADSTDDPMLYRSCPTPRTCHLRG